MAVMAAARGGGSRRKRGAGSLELLGRLQYPSRKPMHPGRFLETRFLAPLAINQTELADALGISRRRVNEMVRGRRAITPDTAMRLAEYFRTDPMFWMQLQLAWDMHAAAKSAHAQPRRSRSAAT